MKVVIITLLLESFLFSSNVYAKENSKNVDNRQVSMYSKGDLLGFCYGYSNFTVYCPKTGIFPPTLVK